MKIFTYMRSHAVLSTGIAIIAVIGMIIAGRVAQKGATTDSNESNTKKVSLVDVNSFRDDLSKVSADGIVESVSQVDLRNQLSAPLAALNVSIGDTVYAGQTIAVMQNADVQAQLDQARAGLQLAQSSSGISLESARKSAIENIRNAYQTADEAVNSKLSQFLYKSNDGYSNLSSYIIDLKKGEAIRDTYLDFQNYFPDWKKKLDGLTPLTSVTDILAVVEISQKRLESLVTLLDNVSEVINRALQDTSSASNLSQINGWQTTVLAARASTNAAIKNLTSTKTVLFSSQVTMNSPAEAQISSAQAIVRNLEAQLAKTIIKSPINGKIAALPLRVGELAQPGQLIATVVGGGGLQVKAYASGEDFLKIKNASKALIQGTILGTVVSVAPSLNETNKKVEVKISVADSTTSGLVIGQNVSVSIEAVEQPVGTASQSNNYLLPIQDVKIIPGFAYVFTVDADSKIVKNPVMIGKIQGDFVEIISGITTDMRIVSPVYELEEGEAVIVQ